MTNFSQLPFPAQMRPELAKHVAETLCWAQVDSPAVCFTELSLLFASWSADKPSTLADYREHLRAAFNQEGAKVMSTLTNEAFYDEQSLKHSIGALTTFHVKQALRYWATRVKPDAVARLAAIVDAIFTAAASDESDRAETLASAIGDAIVAHTPDDEDDAEGGVMIMGPTGPLGPFANIREAASYRTRAVKAFNAGKPLPPLPKRPQASPAQMQQDDEVDASQASEPETGSGLAVYSQETVANLVAKLPPLMPNEGNAQQRRVLEAMAEATGWRRLSGVPEGDEFAKMYRRFPHFSDVLDFIGTNLALAGCGTDGNPVRFPPLLLRGVPGTGKSYFAKEIARVLGTSYVEKDLSVMTEAFVITGMDSAWKGSKPGVVFDALVNGPTANPLICLNEIDKASARSGNNSPLSALYTLMEQESSMNFKDEFVPVALDASRIIWVCTANEGELPDAILERMEVFNIRMPTKEESRLIAISVWDSMCTNVLPKGHRFEIVLGDALLDKVSAMNPRIMRKALTHSAGRAAAKGNTHITEEDLVIAQARYEAAQRRSIGFMSSAQ